MALEEGEESAPAHSTEDLRRRHAALDAHYASAYLNTWCCGPVRKEWAKFLHEVFESLLKKVSECDRDRVVLDVGCGPSMAGVMSASRWSKNIYLCDYLKSNRYHNLLIKTTLYFTLNREKRILKFINSLK